MVAAATTVAFGMNAQDASVETQAIYGHSGTAPQDGIPVTLRIALSRSQYQILDANLHLINLTYQCL